MHQGPPKERDRSRHRTRFFGWEHPNRNATRWRRRAPAGLAVTGSTTDCPQRSGDDRCRLPREGWAAHTAPANSRAGTSLAFYLDYRERFRWGSWRAMRRERAQTFALEVRNKPRSKGKTMRMLDTNWRRAAARVLKWLGYGAVAGSVGIFAVSGPAYAQRIRAGGQGGARVQGGGNVRLPTVQGNAG